VKHWARDSIKKKTYLTAYRHGNYLQWLYDYVK